VRGYGKRTLALSIVVGLIGLVSASSAGAVTTIGQTFAPTKSVCSGAATFVQEATPAGEYTVPFAGVIASWSYQAGNTPPTQLKLKIVHRNFFNNYTIVRESAMQAGLTPNALGTFPTRIPVQAGDRLGLFANLVADCVNGNPASGYAAADVSGDQAVGSTSNYGPDAMERLDVSAVLEPDADNDGFGDETQDNCPATANPGQADADADGIGDDCDPTPNGPPDTAAPDTAAPDTTITKQPKDKTKKKTATFEFTSTEPGSTFLCGFDGDPLTLCTSPKVEKVGKGKHEFDVVAVDPAGNQDATPAEDSWKVKKKKKAGLRE
jgi:hypothetical protein